MMISSLLTLPLVLLLELCHSYARTKTIASITEALGKAVCIAWLVFGISVIPTKEHHGMIRVAIIMGVLTLMCVFVQALVYENQRRRTRDHLRELVTRREGKIRGSSRVSAILEELIDADFIPHSHGNRLSGYHRASSARTTSTASPLWVGLGRTGGPMARPFNLGRVVATLAALRTFSPHVLSACLRRHIAGDWGDLCTEDKEENERALEVGGRLFSSYELPEGKLWIITEADRSATTFLLPEEY